MGDFRKTWIMNIVLASGFIYAGVMHLLRNVHQQPLGLLAAVLGLYGIMVLVPAATAYALSGEASATLQRAMLRANWMLIGFWGLGLSGVLIGTAVAYMTVGAALSALLQSATLTLLPGLVNIRGLRAALASKNSALTPQAERHV
jgi:hypothetical protein